MRYRLSVPARINILGNPGDANEGDFATISAAVEVRAGALVEPADGLVLEGPQLRQEFPRLALPLDYTGDFDLLKGAINRLHAFSPEFRQKFSPQAGVRILTWSDVPPMGSTTSSWSSAWTISTSTATSAGSHKSKPMCASSIKPAAWAWQTPCSAQSHFSMEISCSPPAIT